MEQHEYMDRARQYSTRLAVLSSSLTHWKKLPPLPSLTSQPHQVLASEPIPFSDLQQVSRIAAYAYSALSQIRVDAKRSWLYSLGSREEGASPCRCTALLSSPCLHPASPAPSLTAAYTEP